MRARQIHNLELMAQCWSLRVGELRAELNQQLAHAHPVYPHLRARVRQSALCLVMAREQVEFLTGAPNPQRDVAFGQYTSALGSLSALLSEADVDTPFAEDGKQARSDGESERRAERIETAERWVDAALLQWCAG